MFEYYNYTKSVALAKTEALGLSLEKRVSRCEWVGAEQKIVDFNNHEKVSNLNKTKS